MRNNFLLVRKHSCSFFIRMLLSLFYYKKHINSELAVLLKIRLSCKYRFLN